MRKLTIEKEEKIHEYGSFMDDNAKGFVRCAFIEGQNCSPRCAACEIDEHGEFAKCLRGQFNIGCVKE
jgi:hypothetical protein